MDCKIYLPDGQTVEIVNVKSIKAIPLIDSDGHTTGMATVALYDGDNTQPIASFYGAVGYELVNRR